MFYGMLAIHKKQRFLYLHEKNLRCTYDILDWLFIQTEEEKLEKEKKKKDVKTMRVAKGTNLLKRSGKNLYFIQVKWKGVAKGRAKLFQFLFKTVEKFPKLFSKR